MDLRRSTNRAAAALVVLAALAAPATGAPKYSVKEHYTKYELDIPMRDGVKLHTSVLVPKDRSRRYPILLIRTPYSVGPYGVDNYRDNLTRFLRAGYILVRQDVRGRFMSQGTFVNMRPMLSGRTGPRQIDEGTDAHDTIDQLLKTLPAHNGRVGMMGISYPGFYAAAALVRPHPALRAVSPQAPITDWFIGDDFHHNGALILAPAFNFMAFFGKPRPLPTRKRGHPLFDMDTQDGYDFFLKMGPLTNANTRFFKGQVAFWKDLMQHGVYDAFWRSRDLARHLSRVRPGPAVLTVGGWFDAEDLFGTLQVYRSLERARPGLKNRLVMGPWAHGGWDRVDGSSLGPVQFNAKTSAYYRKQVEFPFFEHHLRGGKRPLKLPKVLVFETGTNQWRAHQAWPPRGARRTLCLQPDGGLAFAPPAQNKPRGQGAFDEYVSDPAKPVPFINFTNISMPREYMVEDQRFAARRTDVLAYQTEPLKQDVTLAGPVSPRLFVSTSGTDSDWVVKLVDVYPDDFPDPRPNPAKLRMGGYQQLVRGEVMRGKFRSSFEKPEPFVPWRVAQVAFTMPDVCHTFRRGHRIMVQVQSSWFPLVDRNPQTFVDIYHAKASDFRKATQRVHRTRQHASCIEVNVLSGPR